MNDRSDISGRFAAHCLERGFAAPGDFILAAVSGGPDSTALLDLLHRWADVGLAAAHFNHRLRPEADAEERAVRELCGRLGIPFHRGEADVAAHARRRRMSVHAAARELRYRFLTEVLQRETPQAAGRAAVATGHHRDDQAETLLMRLFEGAGVEALAGIREVEMWGGGGGVRLIRPLLPFSRAELETYCRSRGLDFAEDRTNLDPAYPRSRIRTRLLPVVVELFGDRALDAVSRSAARLAEVGRYVGAVTDAAYRDAACDESDLEIVLDYRRYFSYLVMLRIGLLKRVIGRLAGRTLRVPLERLEGVDAGFASGRTGAIDIGGGIRAARWKERLYLWREPRWNEELALEPKGRVNVPGFGDISAAIMDSSACRIPPPPATQYCDLDALGDPPWTVRPARPGDRITPLGAERRFKVSDILRENDVPPHRRNHPVVLARGMLAAVPPWRIASWVRLTDRSRRAVAITLTPDRRSNPEPPLKPGAPGSTTLLQASDE